jgi:hypothetical protein
MPARDWGWASDEGERPRLAVHQEVVMAGRGKDAYVAALAPGDAPIRALLDHGLACVTNAVKAGAVPPGITAPTDREQGRNRRPEGDQGDVVPASDEQEPPRPTLSAMWRKHCERRADPLGASAHAHPGRKRASPRYRPTWRSHPWAKSQAMASPPWRAPGPHPAAAKRQANGVGACGVYHHGHANSLRKPS